MPRRDYTSEEIRLALSAFAVEMGRKVPTEKLLREAKLKIPIATLRGWAYRTHADLYQQISHAVEKDQRTRLADDWHRQARESNEIVEDTLRRVRETYARKDAEFADVEERLRDAQDRMGELDAQIDAGQQALAEAMELPDADALIEQILGDDEAVGIDKAAVARLNGNYRRRDQLAGEIERLWRRRDAVEIDLKDLAKMLHEVGWIGAVATDKLNALTGNPTERVEHSFPELQRALEAKGIRLTPGQGAAPSKLPVVETRVLPVAADG